MTDTISVAEYRRRSARAMPERGEGGVQEQVTEIAEALGWRTMHINDRLYAIAAEHERWDAMTGAEDYPDLVMIRGDRLVVVECKSEKERPTAGQREWLQAFEDVGAEVYIFRPVDLIEHRVHSILE